MLTRHQKYAILLVLVALTLAHAPFVNVPALGWLVFLCYLAALIFWIVAGLN